jgi:hypothetical protein
VALIERTLPVGDPADLVGALTDPFGLSEVWLFQNTANQLQLTAAGGAGERLAGTTYQVGSDADPVFSPEADQVAFRRLTGIGGGRGTWELRAVRFEDLVERPLTEGDAHRSAPDWSARGIAFAEDDGAATRLVLLDPATGAVRVVLALAAGVRLDAPRWLTPAP